MTPPVSDDKLRSMEDVGKVHQVGHKLTLAVFETDAYMPSYTRQVMERSHGAPFMAVTTKTDRESKIVFIYPADDPTAANAKILRSSETMGPAYFAFGVPLKELDLTLDKSRQLVLTMNTLEVPDKGTVYFVSFAELEKKSRKTGAKAGGAPAAQAKKGAKGTKAGDGEGLEAG